MDEMGAKCTVTDATTMLLYGVEQIGIQGVKLRSFSCTMKSGAMHLHLHRTSRS